MSKACVENSVSVLFQKKSIFAKAKSKRFTGMHEAHWLLLSYQPRLTASKFNQVFVGQKVTISGFKILSLERYLSEIKKNKLVMFSFMM